MGVKKNRPICIECPICSVRAYQNGEGYACASCNWVTYTPRKKRMAKKLSTFSETVQTRYEVKIVKAKKDWICNVCNNNITKGTEYKRLEIHTQSGWKYEQHCLDCTSVPVGGKSVEDKSKLLKKSLLMKSKQNKFAFIEST